MTLEQARNLTMLAAADLRCAGMRLQKAKAKGDANEVAETLAARDAARAAYDETVRVYAAAKKQSMRL